MRAQVVILRVESVHLRNVGMEVVAFDTYITKAEDQIFRQLLLDFKAPVLCPGWATIAARNVPHILPVQERRIGAVLRRSVTGKTGRERLHRREVVPRGKCRLDGRTAAKLNRSRRQVVVKKRRVVDRVAAAKDYVVDAAKEFRGSIGKTYAGAKILEPGLSLIGNW